MKVTKKTAFMLVLIIINFIGVVVISVVALNYLRTKDSCTEESADQEEENINEEEESLVGETLTMEEKIYHAYDSVDVCTTEVLDRIRSSDSIYFSLDVIPDRTIGMADKWRIIVKYYNFAVYGRDDEYVCVLDAENFVGELYGENNVYVVNNFVVQDYDLFFSMYGYDSNEWDMNLFSYNFKTHRIDIIREAPEYMEILITGVSGDGFNYFIGQAPFGGCMRIGDCEWVNDMDFSQNGYWHYNLATGESTLLESR